MHRFAVRELGDLAVNRLSKLAPIGDSDGVAITRESELVDCTVSIGIQDTKPVVSVHAEADQASNRKFEIDEESFRRILQKLRDLGVGQLEAVFAEDMLDGETYFVVIVDDGVRTESVLSNPRMCGLTQVAEILEEIMQWAGK